MRPAWTDAEGEWFVRRSEGLALYRACPSLPEPDPYWPQNDAEYQAYASSVAGALVRMSDAEIRAACAVVEQMYGAPASDGYGQLGALVLLHLAGDYPRLRARRVTRRLGPNSRQVYEAYAELHGRPSMASRLLDCLLVLRRLLARGWD